MSFQFNFCFNDDREVPNNFFEIEDVTEDEDLTQCGFLFTESKVLEKTNEEISLLNIGDLEIKYVLLKSIELKTGNLTFSQIDALQTDIIPGKYEGGLKIWECSLDLAIYLSEANCIENEDSVLELGCGAGIPGIVAYLKGAKVTFQDFNVEVLEFVTHPNTVLNTSEDKLSTLTETCQYLYGDWASIHKKYYVDSKLGAKYDLIITSETIYERTNFKKLLRLMKSALKREGRIYLAAKIHYFGVGGGITEFEAFVKEDRTFEIVPVFKTTEGVERQILMMKFIKQRQMIEPICI